MSALTLQLGPVRTHNVLFFSSVVQVGGDDIYLWKQLPVTDQVRFSSITNNAVVIPRFSRSIMMSSRFQLPTEQFYILDIRQSAR